MELPQKYDVIFDAMGKTTSDMCKNILKKGGRYLNVNKTSAGTENHNDSLHLLILIEEGRIKPVIDRYYPLDRIAEAHRYVDEGHKKGNVVIEVA